MNYLVPLLIGIIERGLIFSLVVMAIYLTSVVIKFDDLTVEGSFGIGGAAMAAALFYGINWPLALLASIIAGGLAGLCTALLHTQLKLNNLISGIVVTTGLFSIILKIAGANISLMDKSTLFDLASFAYGKLLLLLSLAVPLLYIFKWFLKTEVGFLLYTLGLNPGMLTHLGKRGDVYKAVALILANALTGLAGAVFVQYTGYFSIWASVGMLVIALAGRMLAQAINPGFGIALLLGAIGYQALIALTFEFHIDQSWNKLITALLIIIFLLIKQHLGKKKGVQHAQA
jgi:putative ABC transport system permease protein